MQSVPGLVGTLDGANVQSPLSLSVLTCDFRNQAPASCTGRWSQAGGHRQGWASAGMHFQMGKHQDASIQVRK